MEEMVREKEWEEFRASGLLWWVNMILHTFGWALCVEMNDNKIVNAYPARVKFRGFCEESNTSGYTKVSTWLKENADTLCKEAIEEE